MKAANDSRDPHMQQADPTETLPIVELHDPEDASLKVLRALQQIMLKHPVAAQSAFSALVAEGRAFANTPDGRRLSQKLEGSALLQQANLVFDLSTLSMLEENPPDVLPSTYFDVLFMLAANPASDHILNQLFNPEEPIR